MQCVCVGGATAASDDRRRERIREAEHIHRKYSKMTVYFSELRTHNLNYHNSESGTALAVPPHQSVAPKSYGSPHSNYR